MPQVAAAETWVKPSILFLTHADTDLLTLSPALESLSLPDDFPLVHALNLKTLPTADHVEEFIRSE